ncbi:hypothetical protein Rsub_06259 [Raphidocelis subcapitata]|uniref:EF-hand domain-containing protein n=1 Tax=Raphidocelis subcapitata TaxID=307507 RepID=A0A2V0P1U2_9CHLO|nr:hypothetical protein Rsub_06259 [Raphidocelis subcapitata]|eukprot:GBF93539.1 hypothetical protein Rsub_06259 [Raphidocelis subcapitata]
MIAAQRTSARAARPSAGAAPCARAPRVPVASGRRGARLPARSIPLPSTDVIADADSAKLDKLMKCFKMADVDGNGAIDKQELRMLLESVEEGLSYLMAWEGSFPNDKLDAIFEKYDADKSGTITFDEFQSIVYDGLLLEGTLADYEHAFKAVDDSGNGTIGATELSELFKQLGQPISQDKLVDIFMKVGGWCTPAFLMWRGGEVVGQCSGANKERLEAAIRGALNEGELAGKEALYPPADVPA